jgi:FAD synthase
MLEGIAIEGANDVYLVPVERHGEIYRGVANLCRRPTVGSSERLKSRSVPTPPSRSRDDAGI